MMVWRSVSDTTGCNARITMSALPPGGNVTTILIGWSGYALAVSTANDDKTASAAAPTRAQRRDGNMKTETFKASDDFLLTAVMHERPKAASDMPSINNLVSDPLMTRVLVIGAGPVGLTLAMDLATRGIEVTVVETRSAGEPPSVKCNHVSSRSMEIFRRLGTRAKVARHRTARRLSERLLLSHHGHRHRAVAHPDSLPARPLHRDRRTRHRLADGRAAAPDQPDPHGARAVRARRRHRRACRS